LLVEYVTTGPARPGVTCAVVVFAPCDEVVWLVLCEDELWLEPLDFDFAFVGADASAAAITAMDNDKAKRLFSIAIPPNTNH
jgi:hypothetical protein